MKTSKRNVKNLLVALLLVSAFIILPTGCTDHGPAITKTVSGEELFRGLFFLQGETADVITLFKKTKSNVPFESDPVVKVQYNEIIDEVVNVIKKNNPQFFSGFKRSIQSNDHLEVKKALTQGSEVMHYSLLEAPTVAKILSGCPWIWSVGKNIRFGRCKRRDQFFQSKGD